jgi:DnaJ-class molecular chaperone
MEARIRNVSFKEDCRSDPDEEVNCWKCKGDGEYKTSRYHNRKVMVRCDRCDGSGRMKFKDVPDAHKKYYVEGCEEYRPFSLNFPSL